MDSVQCSEEMSHPDEIEREKEHKQTIHHRSSSHYSHISDSLSDGFNVSLSLRIHQKKPIIHNGTHLACACCYLLLLLFSSFSSFFFISYY